MAGILNSKQRIMDVIITENGRRQIVDNKFDIKYASFSDHGVFYSNDGSGVADQADLRIMFEANTSNTDIIIPEINDTNGISIDTSAGNKITNSRFYTSGSVNLNTSTLQTGSINVFSSSAEIIKTAIDNFDRLQIIGTDSGFSTEKYFRLERSEISFNEASPRIEVIEKCYPLFSDPALSNQLNFRYMPPVYLDENTSHELAEYPKFQSKSPHSTIDTLKEELYSDGQSESFKIESTYSTDLLCQLFEIGPTGISKLAIVDYGSYYDSFGNFKGQLYHLGKLYKDKNNIPKFIKLLCVLFE